MRINGNGGLLHVAQIRFAALIERRGNTNEDGVGFPHLREIVACAEVPAVDELLDLVLRNVLDVGLTGIEHRHFVGIGIKSCDSVPRFGEAQRQGQADVAAANDSHFELGAFEKLGFPVDGHEFRRTPIYV